MCGFRRALPVLPRSRTPLIAGHRNRSWNRLECRDRNHGSPSLSARDARASVRATIPDRRPRADRAIASHRAESLTMELSAQSAPAVPDDRACHNRRSWGREKFARDLLARFQARDKRTFLVILTAIDESLNILPSRKLKMS